MRISNRFLSLLTTVCLLAGPIAAAAVTQTKQDIGAGNVDSNAGFDRQTPIVIAYEKTHKAVVNMSGRRLVATSVWPGFDWPDIFEEHFFFGPRYRRKAQLVVLGSGIVIHEDGYMVTNAHVIKDTDQVKVTFSDGSEYSARIISADETKDLAVLKIEAEGKLPFIHLGRSDDLMIGETVIAIGNPYGYAHTLTSGVISALGRDVQVYEDFWLRGLIQTDAPINRGNSGGPLLNINGALVGINTAINPQAQNIGFAIPVDTLADGLVDMLMPEKLRRVRLGLVIGRMKSSGGHTGLVVDSVVKGSPADEKGVKAGDLLLRIDGRDLYGFIDFYVKMMDKEIGEPIVIEYVTAKGQGRQKRAAKLTMAARPLPDGRQVALEFFQMEVSELTDKVAREFGYASSYPVLIVTDVEKPGQAQKAGITAGDLILQINEATASNLKEFSLEMEKISEGSTATVEILRIVHKRGFEIRRQETVRLEAKSQKIKRQFL